MFVAGKGQSDLDPDWSAPELEQLRHAPDPQKTKQVGFFGEYTLLGLPSQEIKGDELALRVPNASFPEEAWVEA